MSLKISITINGEGKIEKTWIQQQTRTGLRPSEASGSSGDTLGNHALASGGGTFRRSRVRRGSRCGGGRGHRERGGGGSAAAKTKQLGVDDKRPEGALETVKWEV